MKKRKLKKTFVGIIIIVLFAILGFLIYKVVASPEEKEVKEVIKPAKVSMLVSYGAKNDKKNNIQRLLLTLFNNINDSNWKPFSH